jgi:hypothetical protein
MVRSVFGILLCAAAMSGCAVHEVHKDQDMIRTTLLDLYTNQIMDNLVRAANGLPIIQLDYTNAAATVTITNTIGGNDTQATTASNVLALPAATLSATRTILTTLMGTATNMNQNQIAITAQPVTTSNDVYDAYISFLDSEKNPNSLIVTPYKPDPDQAHICRKFNGQYYWVPMMYRKLFFQLALLTTAQRGKALQEPDKFYAVTLKDPVKREDNPTFPGMGYVLIFDVDKQKIPIDSGYLVVDNDKANTQIPIQTIAASATAGYNLQLMSSLKDASGIPTAGDRLIIVAAVDHVLHFRIFNVDGKMVVDTDEKKLTQQPQQIEGLRKQLESVWPPHELTQSEKARLIAGVTSIVGYNPTAGSIAPTVSAALLVTISHDDLELQLSKAGEKAPVNGKNLLYVSIEKDKNDNKKVSKVGFLFFDGNGQKKAFTEDDVKDKVKLTRIKRGLDDVETNPLTADDKSQLIYDIRRICDYYPNAKLSLFSPLPQTGKLFLKTNAPKVPTTEDALNRVNFQLQQIWFNQLRQPGM